MTTFGAAEVEQGTSAIAGRMNERISGESLVISKIRSTRAISFDSIDRENASRACRWSIAESRRRSPRSNVGRPREGAIDGQRRAAVWAAGRPSAIHGRRRRLSRRARSWNETRRGFAAFTT
jgi:hypothetical protein